MHNRSLSGAHRHIVAAMVEVVMPHYPTLDAAARQNVETDVIEFVAGQVAAIASTLRLPYLLALTAFDLLPLLRFGRRFVNLDRPRQASYLERWSDAPLAPMRNVVKLIRSCALLMYFDHAAVRREIEGPAS